MSQVQQAPIGRREARKAERRAAIIAVAQRHFLKHGYDRTSMSAIVDEMGGSKGTLWSYFSSKEELFAASIEQVTVAFQATMTEILDPANEFVPALTVLAEKFIERITSCEAVALQRLIIGEVERVPEIGAIFHQRAPEISRRILANYFAVQMRNGTIAQDDPVEAARVFFDLCSGEYHQRILWGVEKATAAATKREADFAMRLFLRCYPRG